MLHAVFLFALKYYLENYKNIYLHKNLQIVE
jgi:hypothetical protein